MPVFQNHAGFNLTRRKLQLVEIVIKENNFCLENVDEYNFSSEFDLTKKENELIDILQEAFSAVTADKKLNARNISFSLGNQFFKIAEFPYDDSLTQKDLYEHFKWELSILYPGMNKDSLLLQHLELDKGKRISEHRTVVLALDKKLVGILHKFALLNSLDLKLVDNAHFASNAFISLQNADTKDSFFLSLYIGKDALSVILLDGNFPVYFKVRKWQGNNLFEMLQNEFNSFSELKISTDEIKKVFVTGDDVPDVLVRKVHKEFELLVQKINPFLRLEVSDELKKSSFLLEKYNSFAPACGVALRII